MDKKKRAYAYGQKNKLEEIDKPRGFDRNLPIERILGATDCKGVLMFLLKWVGCDEYDLLPVSEINERDPATVIAYYEARSPLVRKCVEKAAIQAEINGRSVEGPQEEAKVTEDEQEIVKNSDPADGLVPEVSDEPMEEETTENHETTNEIVQDETVSEDI